MKKLASVIVVFITFPIWIFLLYTCIKAASADRLVWFLFYVYVPLDLFVQIIFKLTEE